MDKLNPNELDAIFREGADRHEFTYNADAWKSLEKKLDKKDRRRRWLPILLLGLLVLATAGWYLTSTSEDDKQVANSEDTSLVEKADVKGNITNESPNEVAVSKQVTSEEGLVSLTADTRNKVKTTTTSTGQTIASTAPVAGTDTAEKNYPTVRSTTAAIASQGTSNAVTSVDAGLSSQVVADEKSTAAISAEGQLSGLQKGTKVADIGSSTTSDKVQVGLQRLALLQVRLEHMGSSIDPTLVDYALPSMIEIPAKYAFSVYAGPEWTSVGLLTEQAAGWRAGLSAGMMVGRHVELGTGISVSRKIFSCPGNEYSMNGGWTGDIMPHTLDSKTYILDIPVYMTYYVKGTESNGAYFSAGLSSYFVSSEWYGFDYTQEDLQALTAAGNEPMMEVFEKNVNQHLVGLANISVGYQARLRGGTFVQIEPYMQLPLTGIGSGKLNLYSTGIKMGIRLTK